MVNEKDLVWEKPMQFFEDFEMKKEFMRFEENGDIYIRGKFVINNIEVSHAITAFNTYEYPPDWNEKPKWSFKESFEWWAPLFLFLSAIFFMGYLMGQFF